MLNGHSQISCGQHGQWSYSPVYCEEGRLGGELSFHTEIFLSFRVVHGLKISTIVH